METRSKLSAKGSLNVRRGGAPLALRAMRRRHARVAGLLLLASSAAALSPELTDDEVHECEAHPELIEFELRGGVALEILLMLYVVVFMYVLIEEYYVEALELMCSKEVLGIPKALVGCTIIAAGNCLPELCISLVAMLVNGADIGTGEVLGSCVFDVLAILGVVCLKLPREGLRLPLPLMVYFLLWILTSTAINLLLFYTNDASTWPVAALMILLYVVFVAGIFLLNRCVDLSEHGAEQHAVAPAALPAPKEDSPLIAGAADRGDGGGGDLCGELCCSRACARTCTSERALRCLFWVPRLLFRLTVPPPQARLGGSKGLRLWPVTIFMCIAYTLAISFSMVAVASRAICLLGVRKNALGATALCLAAGFPDLITVVVLCDRPGMQQMAASNSFGAYAFNSFVALGLPWVILGLYSDVFPPARGTWFTAVVGFSCIGAGMGALLLSRLRLNRSLGIVLLLLYLFYLIVVSHDGLRRPRRPPELLLASL